MGNTPGGSSGGCFQGDVASEAFDLAFGRCETGRLLRRHSVVAIGPGVHGRSRSHPPRSIRPCRKSATDELISLVPMLRRLPRRLDRITGSLEHGRLGLNIRLLADQSDRRYLTGLVHQLVLTFLAATLGVMFVLMLGLHGGPRVTHTITLYAFIGYCLLVFAGILALRVLVLVFRPAAD